MRWLLGVLYVLLEFGKKNHGDNPLSCFMICLEYFVVARWMLLSYILRGTLSRERLYNIYFWYYSTTFKYFAWKTSNEKACFISTKHCIWKIKHCYKIQHWSRPMQHCRSRMSTISNHKSNLNDAICLCYFKNCTKQTLTDRLVAENLFGSSLSNEHHG